jgi:pyridoxine kinase
MPDYSKRIAVIQDLSGIGRSSMAVAVPILSIMGHQVCQLPTAILSSTTGVFEGFSFLDYTPCMQNHIAQWKALELEFGAISTGFLASEKQIPIIMDFIAHFRYGKKSGNRAITVVDPVMGDNGRLYETYTAKMCQQMRELVCCADVITPNLTEAAFLLDEPYPAAVSPGMIGDWACRLGDMGPKFVVITGLPLEKGVVSDVGYWKPKGELWRTNSSEMWHHYPGTGDIFASVLLGGLVRGDTLPVAMGRATAFVHNCSEFTQKVGAPIREGVILERFLPTLIQDDAIVPYQEL